MFQRSYKSRPAMLLAGLILAALFLASCAGPV